MFALSKTHHLAMVTPMHWKCKSLPPSVGEAEIRRLAEELHVTPVTVQLLLLRGICQREAMHRFLSPRLRYLRPVGSWPGVDHAAQIVARAVAEGKRIAIWGDYDVDGITATVLAKDSILAGGVVAVVNKDLCCGCQGCVQCCPFGAITYLEQEAKCEVNQALCKGCGTCAATCPSEAITLLGFSHLQLYTQIDEALTA